MTLSELRKSLALILSLEEDSPVDWTQVQSLTSNLANDLGAGVMAISTDPFVFEYLTGWELRRADPVFAHAQRTSLAAFIRSSQ
jgi:hypothetical protein